MSLKRLIASAAGTVLLASVGIAQADTYKPGEFLLLDLPKAVLSPKPLGPSARFERFPIEARADVKNELDAAADKPRTPVQKAVPVVKPQGKVTAKTTVPARSRLARARSNPLDANARDTRVQVWPCKSGAMCGWQKK